MVTIELETRMTKDGVAITKVGGITPKNGFGGEQHQRQLSIIQAAFPVGMELAPGESQKIRRVLFYENGVCGMTINNRTMANRPMVRAF